jgi:hypothetical protein
MRSLLEDTSAAGLKSSLPLPSDQRRSQQRDQGLSLLRAAPLETTLNECCFTNSLWAVGFIDWLGVIWCLSAHRG